MKCQPVIQRRKLKPPVFKKFGFCTTHAHQDDGAENGIFFNAEDHFHTITGIRSFFER